MAMTTGGASQPTINVTPLIDVLLVLLIIFMVITPVKQVGLPALVPQPSQDQSPDPAPRRDVVVMVRGDGMAEINTQPVTLEELPRRLTAIFGGSPGATIFIDGERDLEYRHVARVIDLARGAGVLRVGFMPSRN
jgi:biopolymer transport protein ExbD